MNHIFVALCFKLCHNRAEAIGETCDKKKGSKLNPNGKNVLLKYDIITDSQYIRLNPSPGLSHRPRATFLKHKLSQIRTSRRDKIKSSKSS